MPSSTRATAASTRGRTAMRERPYQDAVGVVLSGWEFAALAFGVVPTISFFVKERPMPERFVIWGVASLWLFDHWVTQKRC